MKILFEMSTGEAEELLKALSWRCNQHGLVEPYARILYKRLHKLVERSYREDGHKEQAREDERFRKSNSVCGAGKLHDSFGNDDDTRRNAR